MLEMNERRLDYSEQLRPGNGFEVVFAVGTTYSLDMTALLNVCLALGLGEVADDAMKDNQVGLFAAVEKLQGKLNIFCEQGRIKANDKSNPLCMLFENMITQVVVNRNKPLASFHPKVWVVEYANGATKEHRWRLVVLSRNLTFDTSWDVAVRLDGTVKNSTQKNSAPIANFLHYVARQAGTENKTRQSEIGKFANRVKKVRFEVDTQNFDSFEFFPFGPGLSKASESKLFTTNLDNAIVMSPFLSNSGPLEILSENRTTYGKRSGTFALIARDYQLATLNEDIASKYKLYTPESALSDFEIEGDIPASAYADLHAKLYYADAGGDRDLYLGSLNASANGFYNNVECLIQLHARKRKLLFEDILKSFVGNEAKLRGAFSPVEFGSLVAGDIEDETSRALESALHRLAKDLVFEEVVVASAKDDIFILNCTLAIPPLELPSGTTIELSPYMVPNMSCKITSQSTQQTLSFGPLKMRQVSAFFSLVAKDARGNESRCVIKCPESVFNDSIASLEDRTKNLISSILESDTTALALYINLAFGIRPSDSRGGTVQGTGSSWQSKNVLGSGLYERLLVASMENPQVLETASMLINLIPERFEEKRIEAMRDMLASFKKAVS